MLRRSALGVRASARPLAEPPHGPVFPPDLGGLAVDVPSIAKRLVERGHDVKVVALGEELHPTADARILLTICRRMIGKGVDGILRARARLPEDHCVVVCGDGEERESWQRLARDLGVEERVRWAGNVPHAEVIAHIRAADVFVQR